MEVLSDDEDSTPHNDQNIEDDNAYKEPPILTEYFSSLRDKIIKQCNSSEGPAIY